MKQKERQPVSDVSDIVTDYINSLYAIPLLTREEEITLANRMDEGKIALKRNAAGGTRLSAESKHILQEQIQSGFDAQEELIIRNRRLVVSIAKKYQGRGMDFIDLISEGEIGLIRATPKYDVSRNTKFSTHATWWIDQAIERAVAEQVNIIRAPVWSYELVRKVYAIQKRLTQEMGRTPTPDEIAAQMKKKTGKDITNLLEKSRPVLSLQQSIDDEEHTELGEVLPDSTELPIETQTDQNQLREMMEESLQYLPVREALILKLRYGLTERNEGMTLAEVGRKLNVSRERIRQIESQALNRLRHPSFRRRFRDFLLPDSE